MSNHNEHVIDYRCREADARREAWSLATTGKTVAQVMAEAVTLPKSVMRDGQWVIEPHILTRGPNGLSDKPARTK